MTHSSYREREDVRRTLIVLAGIETLQTQGGCTAGVCGCVCVSVLMRDGVYRGSHFYFVRFCYELYKITVGAS